MTPETAAELEALEGLADWMDSRFRIPGTEIRFGLDALIGLAPGVGDGAALAPSAYILYRAKRMGASTPLLLRMAANIGIDALVGAIPLIGDLFDIGFKANRRNIVLLRDWLIARDARL